MVPMNPCWTKADTTHLSQETRSPGFCVSTPCGVLSFPNRIHYHAIGRDYGAPTPNVANDSIDPLQDCVAELRKPLGYGPPATLIRVNLRLLVRHSAEYTSLGQRPRCSTSLLLPSNAGSAQKLVSVAPGRPDLRACNAWGRNKSTESFRLIIFHTYASSALHWPRDGAALLSCTLRDSGPPLLRGGRPSPMGCY